MSRAGASSLNTIYNRVPGRYSTLGAFFGTSGTQESLSSGSVSTECYHTRLFSTDAPASVTLYNGLQDGQLKKLTMAFKGHESADVEMHCPALSGAEERITFKEPGDFALLMWTGGVWVVLETGNTVDPSAQPLVS